MKIKNLILTLSLLYLALGCGNNTSAMDNESNAGITITHNDEVDMHQSEEEGNAVNLNNGMKWKANAETTQGIEDMKNEISKFDKSNVTPISLKELSIALNSDYQNVFAKCTMTGDAHTNLHHYLLPINGMLKEIENSEPQNGLLVIAKLEEHLNSYSIYFE